MDNDIQNIQNQETGLVVRQPEPVRNPDAFDVGHNIQQYNQQGQQIRQDPITEIVTNPTRTIQSFDLTENQLENIIAFIAGTGAGIGAGLATKHLSKTFGEEFAAALGGALGGLAGGYAGKRIVRGRRPRSRFIE